jgi:hypothetical protein
VGTVTIRGERHSAMQALNRQVAHYGLHVGQIVMRRGSSPDIHGSVPENQSVEFN